MSATLPLWDLDADSGVVHVVDGAPQGGGRWGIDVADSAPELAPPETTVDFGAWLADELR